MFKENTINAFAYPDMKLGYIVSGNPAWELEQHWRLDALGDMAIWSERLEALPLWLPDMPPRTANGYTLRDACCRARVRWRTTAKYADFQRCYTAEARQSSNGPGRSQRVRQNSIEQKILYKGFRNLMMRRETFVFIGGFVIDEKGLCLILGDERMPEFYWLMRIGCTMPLLALALGSHNPRNDARIYHIFVEDYGTTLRVREHWKFYRSNGGNWLSDGQELYFDLHQIDWRSPVVPVCRFMAQTLVDENRSLLDTT